MTREELIAAGYQSTVAKSLIESDYKGEVYTIREAAALMQCSRQAVYARCNAGDLELVHVCRIEYQRSRGYVTKRSVDAFISEGKGERYDKHRPKSCRATLTSLPPRKHTEKGAQND